MFEGEREGKKRKEKKQEEFMGIKPKQSVFVGKRGGNSTPITTWKIGFAHSNGSLVHLQDSYIPIITTPSPKKIGSSFRKIQTLYEAVDMKKTGCGVGHQNYEKDEIVDLPTQMVQPPSLTKQVASYDSAVTPASPLDTTHKGEVNYSVKTSAELLKVLNRIWSLEEQHASNLSLMKSLKRELNDSYSQIKKMLKEKQRERQDTYELMEQTAENIAVRRKKEQDRIKDAVLSVRDEVESERKLRKQSESLHRKLARELAEAKSSFSSSLKELERERKGRLLLENLCDEFAKGIRDYEQEVRFLRNKPDKSCSSRESPDRLILHISESWLDERMQMKLGEVSCGPADKYSIVDTLSYEIESFLRAKQLVLPRNVNGLTSKKPKGSSLRRYSLESFHLNDAASAPRNGDYEEDSTGSGFNSFESKRNRNATQTNGDSKLCDSYGQELMKSNSIEKKVQSSPYLFESSGQSSLQNQVQEDICNGNHATVLGPERGKERWNNLDKLQNYKKLETNEATEEGEQQRLRERAESNDFNSVQTLYSTTRKVGKLHRDKHRTEYSLDRSASTSQITIKHEMMTTPRRDRSEPSREGLQGTREHSLKARLLEAKLESQHSRKKTLNAA